MANGPEATAAEEVRLVRDDCLGLITGIKAFPSLIRGEPYPEMFRLMATPLLYSTWERCFTLCHAIALKLLRDLAANPAGLTGPARAVWLLRTPFYDSLRTHLGSALERSPKRGHYKALCDFIEHLESWSQGAFDRSSDTSDLVMTFSNVNEDVVALNARAIGLDELPDFKLLKLGRLHDLVGRRNDIGHGGTIKPPANETFVELVLFCEWLIDEYCALFIGWISTAGNRVARTQPGAPAAA
jgi:hypothetical protein